MTCEMFALCDRDAIGFTRHPILQLVPSCERCAAKLHASFVCDSSRVVHDFDGSLTDLPCGGVAEHVVTYEVVVPQCAEDEGASDLLLCDSCAADISSDSDVRVISTRDFERMI